MSKFDEVARFLTRMDFNLGNKLCFEPHILHFDSLLEDEKRPYYKYPVCKDEKSGKEIVMIFWAPGGGTRPHSHGGSPARIRVLAGILRQEIFNLTQDALSRTRLNSTDKLYGLKQKEIIEQPGVIHRISNQMTGVWAVSLHEFDENFSMQIYDFDRNLQWPVQGDDDTLIDPPEDAIRIW